MRDAWDQMQTWQLVLPPSRPSAAQLNRIKRDIKGVARSAPVAILGSTPEFRDLVHELGFAQVYVLERNREFHRLTSEARIYRNSENLIEGDWLDTLPRLSTSFDLILSDLTMGNIPYNQREEFYAGIAGALRHGGLFCDKVLTHPKPHIPLITLSKKYARLPLNLLYINHFSCEALFCSELLNINQTVDTPLFYERLRQWDRSHRFQAFVTACPLITPVGPLWHYGKPWSDLEPLYCRTLTLLDRADDVRSSPYYGRLKFYTFVKE